MAKSEHNLMKIGLFGGTFDPVHNGHLALAKRAHEILALDTVVFIPAFIPPHKTAGNITTASQRYDMLQYALNGQSWCSISDIELRKKDIAYSVDTIRELKTQYPSEARFFFLVGSDFLYEYHTWKEPEELFLLTTVVVATRPGFSCAVVPEGVSLLEGAFPEIASRDIRLCRQSGTDISEMVPASVATYITEHGLYQSS